ncbi:MAG: GIY-YIG nuclease family protein [Deltaproteobacteria bacterium]|nr:GIY-YIG nuclease family protein [Deltaproteobacteria bacterium]
MTERTYYVYLLTNWNNKVMYVGVTNDLRRRLFEHKNKMIKGFTEKYNVNKLVYEIMPEYPVLCTGMNGILIIPSPLEGSTHIPLPRWEGLGRVRGKQNEIFTPTLILPH